MHAGAFVPSLPWALPFLALLLAIAVLPLAARHFWESNLRKLAVAAVLGLPVLVLYLRGHPLRSCTWRSTTSRSSSCSAGCS